MPTNHSHAIIPSYAPIKREIKSAHALLSPHALMLPPKSNLCPTTITTPKPCHETKPCNHAHPLFATFYAEAINRTQCK
ncbi:hypothetical protein VTJ04DRAFT_8535 [Mycothermus thermophilus]|uniref:uncharacterized protein n=1 Tax=Humicola insolens TaxID=85995 RepID=UPI00374456B0